MPLLYRTRAQAHPQGKCRVLLTGLPRDVERWLDKAAKMILGLQDCAVFYVANDAKTAEVESELAHNIADFQLMVVLVSSKLLAYNSFVLCKLIPRALETCTPVLPILMESDLSSRYQSSPLCNLQYLDLYPTDPTELDPTTKLQSFLDDRLANDELRDRVRQAFDGYIFMSYRKKDRADAQTLMRAIHTNPLCRDIAIWYDEFLVLGEDFNDSIAQALQKSNVFTLVVTPNILEEGNYVIREEYPAAQRAGKIIEPVEMRRVDPQRLTAAFNGIDKVVDASNTSSMEALATRIRNSVGPMQKGAPHEYMIGVAYLYGIDVETDANRASALIEKTANEGYLEARSMIANMFQTGNGVQRDLAKSLRYRKLEIDQILSQYVPTGNSDLTGDLKKALGQLIDTSYEMGRQKDCIGTCKAVLSRIDAIPSCPPSFHAWLLTRLGFCYSQVSKLPEAYDYLDKAYAEYQHSRCQSSILEYFECISVFSDVAFLLGKYDAALLLRYRALELARQFECETGEEYTKRNLCLCLGKYAESLTMKGKYRDAISCTSEAADIAKQLADEFGYDAYGRNLVIALWKKSNAQKLDGLVNEACESCEKALEVSQRVVKESGGTQGSYRNLSLVHYNLADLLIGRNNRKALVHANEAAKIRRKLIKSVDVSTDKEYLAMCLWSASQCYRGLDQENDCIARGKEAVKLMEEFAKGCKEPSPWQALADWCQELGDILGNRSMGGTLATDPKANKLALLYYQKSIVAYEKLFTFPGSNGIDFIKQYCHALINHGKELQKAWPRERASRDKAIMSAKKSLEEASDLADKLIQFQHSDLGCYYLNAMAKLHLGKLHYRARMPDFALSKIESVLKNDLAKFGNGKTSDLVTGIKCECMLTLALINDKKRKPQAVENYFKETFDCLRTNIGIDQEKQVLSVAPILWELLIISYLHYSRFLQRRKPRNLQLLQEVLEEAASDARVLMQATREDRHWELYAVVLFEQIRTAPQAERAKLRNIALDACDQHAKTHPDSPRPNLWRKRFQTVGQQPPRGHKQQAYANRGTRRR